ncbi:MAG: exo-alpha-sialidase [Betaproteobacteria bacterium]|nr:exo-alpha-sialidase [Betaproteobacteria bacterium]
MNRNRRNSRFGATVSLAALFFGLAGAAFAADMAATPGMGKKAKVELGSSAAFEPGGSLLAVTQQGEHLLLYRSSDEGANWSAPVVVNAQPEAISADGENRPKIAFAHDGGVLVSWTKPLGKPNTGEIRLARADDGEHFSAPITVHRDRAEITHRFESMLVAPDGRVLLAWIDKRDLEQAKAAKAAKEAKEAYRGAAIYAAVSTDGGRSFQPERKLADHSCECCRLTSANDADGTPLFMWRHVFAPNERDHAIVRVKPDGSPEALQRATFDRWKIDGCPHHGPSLAVDAAGVRHAVWFNRKDGESRVFYGRLEPGKEETTVAGQRTVGGARAEHADLAVAGRRVAVVWKEFDGERARIWAEMSDDGGLTFRAPQMLADSAGSSDQPRALARGATPYVFWRTEREGMRVFSLR